MGKDEEDKVVVVCRRADDGHPHFKDTGRANCDQCKVEVYLSPASRKAMEDGNGIAVCAECAFQGMKGKNPDEIRFIGPTPEQQAELMRHWLNEEGNEETRKS